MVSYMTVLLVIYKLAKRKPDVQFQRYKFGVKMNKQEHIIVLSRY